MPICWGMGRGGRPKPLLDEGDMLSRSSDMSAAASDDSVKPDPCYANRQEGGGRGQRPKIGLTGWRAGWRGEEGAYREVLRVVRVRGEHGAAAWALAHPLVRGPTHAHVPALLAHALLHALLGHVELLLLVLLRGAEVHAGHAVVELGHVIASSTAICQRATVATNIQGLPPPPLAGI